MALIPEYQALLGIKNSITKYHTPWQILRTSLHSIPVSDKLEQLESYLKDYPTLESLVRVLNYLQSVVVSLKSTKDKHLILQAATKYDKMIDHDKHERQSKEFHFDSYKHEDLERVYKEIMHRYKDWLNMGYRNDDQEEYLKALSDHLRFKWKHLPKKRVKKPFRFIF